MKFTVEIVTVENKERISIEESHFMKQCSLTLDKI